MGRGSSVCRREKASSRWVRAAARLAESSGGIEKSVRLAGTALRDPMLRAVERADDPLKQIVEIVRQTARELAHCFHLLCLTQLFFEVLTLGDIARRHGEATPLSCFRRYRAHDRLHRRAALRARIPVGAVLAHALARWALSARALSGSRISSVVLPITWSRDIP